MLPEALVIFACVNSSGCPETSSLYFSYRPEVKKVIDIKAKQARNLVGPRTVDTIGPLLFYVAGGTGNINLHRHLNLQISREKGILVFNWTF